ERDGMNKDHTRQARSRWQWLGWLSICMPLMFALLALGDAPAAAQSPGHSPAPPQPSADGADRASYATLADLLENDGQRAQLIEQLRALAGQGAAPPQDAQPARSPDPAPARNPAAGEAGAHSAAAQARPAAGFSVRLADKSQAFVDGLAASARTTVTTLRDLFAGRIDDAVRLPDWGGLLVSLALVILATAVVFLILRAVAARLYDRM